MSAQSNKLRTDVKLRESEVTPFDMYFCSLGSMNLHPGTTRDPPSKLSLVDIANISLDMIEVRRRVLMNAEYRTDVWHEIKEITDEYIGT